MLKENKSGAIIATQVSLDYEAECARLFEENKNLKEENRALKADCDAMNTDLFHMREQREHIMTDLRKLEAQMEIVYLILSDFWRREQWTVI